MIENMHKMNTWKFRVTILCEAFTFYSTWKIFWNHRETLCHYHLGCLSLWYWKQKCGCRVVEAGDQAESYISRHIWGWIELGYRSQFIKLEIRNLVINLSNIYYQLRSRKLKSRQFILKERKSRKYKLDVRIIYWLFEKMGDFMYDPFSGIPSLGLLPTESCTLLFPLATFICWRPNPQSDCIWR